MGLNHSCVSSSKKKKASHIHDSNDQNTIDNIGTGDSSKYHFEQLNSDKPSNCSPPVKRIAKVKDSSSSIDKPDGYIFEDTKLSLQGSTFINSPILAANGQIYPDCHYKLDTNSSTNIRRDNECYNCRATNSEVNERNATSTPFEMDKYTHKNTNFSIKVIHTSDGKQYHILSNDTLTKKNSFAKGMVREKIERIDVKHEYGRSINPDLMSANGTQDITTTSLSSSAYSPFGHESKQRRRVLMKNYPLKTKLLVTSSSNCLNNKGETCFTKQALDNSCYEPGKLFSLSKQLFRDSSEQNLCVVPILCLDEPSKVYVCDIGLSNEQCEEIIAKAESASNGVYAAYTYAKQTIGCRDHDEIAHMCEVPVLIACATIRYHFGSSKLTLDDREPHIVKYDISKKERQKLDMHTDKSEWTFIISLSEPKTDFCGGGTFFEDLDATVHLRRGQALLFPGKLRHRGEKITRGTRFLLVGFMINKPD